MTQTLSSAPLNESEDPEPVSLRFRFDSETVEQFAERYASDVSRGGIFVHSRQPFAVGTQVKLNLQLLDGTPIIVGEGTVFWTREPDPNKPATIPGMGVRFSKLTGHSQRVIELVLSQRTGRERSGLFPTLNASVVVEESGRHPIQANPKSKLPFNVFPGNRPAGAPGADDSRELLATSGREEATPLVGVSAATLADARPGKDEPPSRMGSTGIRPAAQVNAATATGSGAHSLPVDPKRTPPALALIKQQGTGEHKGADASKPIMVGDSGKVVGDSGKVSTSGRARLPTPAPAVTSTQELAPPAPGRSSGVSSAVAAPALVSARVSGRNKMIIGAAALFAVSLVIFATTRRSSVDSTAGNVAARTTAGTPTAARPTAPTPSAHAGEPAAVAHAPAAPATETGSAPALEPEAPATTSSGKSSSSSSSTRVADRRAPKGKPAPAHRPDPAPTAKSAAPSERPPVAEAPAPRVEAPPPAPAAVVRAEPPPPPAPVVHAEPPAAPKFIAPTAPPPVATMSHKLRLTSIPSEADVELDGKVIGRTPLFGVEVDVTRSHTLLVRKDGFAPFKQTIGATSEWSVRPSENTATLRIQAFMKKGM